MVLVDAPARHLAAAALRSSDMPVADFFPQRTGVCF